MKEVSYVPSSFTCIHISIVFMCLLTRPAHAPAEDCARSLADTVETALPGVVNIRTRDAMARKTADKSFVLPHERPIDKLLEMFLLPPLNENANAPRSLGSGFFYSSREFIVTNYHVVRDAASIHVVTTQPSHTFSASLLGFDERTDIAVLRLETATRGKVLSFARSEDTRLGETVFAIGNPFGFGHSVTKGILSAKGRTIGAGPFNDFLQTDAAINPGNSGGPLFNLSGRVIGINTAMASDAQGISFAIPSETAEPVIRSIIANGRVKRGWIGVSLSDIVDGESMVRSAYGVYINKVIEGSPADQGGLQMGDVILGINGKQVKDISSFEKNLGMAGVSERLNFTVFRKGKTMRVQLGVSQDPPSTSDSLFAVY